jgi:hypothetical protein
VPPLWSDGFTMLVLAALNATPPDAFEAEVPGGVLFELHAASTRAKATVLATTAPVLSFTAGSSLDGAARGSGGNRG